MAQVKRDASTILRSAFLVLATLVGLHSLWVLAAEIARPSLRGFPSTAAAAEAAAGERRSALLAARIGGIRGDLWSEAAIAEFARLGFGSGDPAAAANGNADATAARRAAAWSPHDARAWLLLAAANARLDWVNRRVIEWLKLSFYTGPNETELMPLRLALITRSRAIDDAEIQELARLDLQAMITRLPQLKPAVVEAYQGAYPEGKKFIAAAAAALDPAFAKTLQ
jgi:hypothetical protein